MTTPASPATVEELRAAQAKEYGQWVALGPIALDGVRAFNTGDPVPASHVDGGIVARKLVAKPSTKAGQAATENGA